MVPASPDHALAARGPLRPLTPQQEQESRSGLNSPAVTTIPSSFASSFVGRLVCSRPQPVRTQKDTWVGAGKEGGERGTGEPTEARERPNFEM